MSVIDWLGIISSESNLLTRYMHIKHTVPLLILLYSKQPVSGPFHDAGFESDNRCTLGSEWKPEFAAHQGRSDQCPHMSVIDWLGIISSESNLLTRYMHIKHTVPLLILLYSKQPVSGPFHDAGFESDNRCTLGSEWKPEFAAHQGRSDQCIRT